MDTSGNANSERKGALDSLTHDELLRKCKGLLGILKNAKKAKDDLTIEVNQLKEKLTECDTQKHADKDCLKTMQVMVDALTENKLSAANKIADLEKSIKNLSHQLNVTKEKLSELEIENEAKDKRIQRLTDENEEQEMDLRKLDEKLAKVSELSQRQTQELLVLEQSVDRWNATEATCHKLQQENKDLQSKIEALQKQLTDETTIPTNQHEDIVKSIEIERDHNRHLYDETKAQLDALKMELEQYKETQAIDENDKIDVLKEQLQHENEQLKKLCEDQAYKLNKYKAKVCEFSGKLKEVKHSRKLLTDTVIDYSNSVAKWQVQIAHASKLMIKEVNNLSEAKVALEKQFGSNEELVKNLRAAVQELEGRLEEATKSNEVTDILGKYESLLAEYKSLQKVVQEKDTEIASFDALKQREIELKKQLEIADRAINDSKANITDLKNRLVEAIKSNQSNDIEEKYETLLSDFKSLQNDVQDKDSKIKALGELKEMKINLEEQLNSSEQMVKDLRATIDDLEIRLEEATKQTETKEIKEKYEMLLIDYKSLQTEFENKNSEIVKLTQEFEEIGSSLKAENEKRCVELDKITAECQAKSQQILKMQENETIAQEKNNELLAEMRELNDVLKTRGEMISGQTAEIDQIKTKLSEQTKQILALEENLKEKTKQLEQLRNQMDSQSEILSTSTISRADEVSRMRDIEDSFEEKYNKIRVLALKLKKKNAEQQSIITKLETNAPEAGSVPNQNHNLISLQKENDRLLDQIDSMKSEEKKFKAEINQLNQQIKKLEDEAKSLRIVNEDIKSTADANKKIKSALDDKIKAGENQIEMLKNENKNMIQQMKNVEHEITKLKDVIKQKENEIAQKSEEISKLKSEINKLKASTKKSSVLNLEVEAYEKSLTEVSQKYDSTVKQLSEAKNEIENHETSTKKLTVEIQSLTNQLDLEKQNSNEYQQQNELQRIKIKENGLEINELKRIIDDHVKESNQIKIELANLQSQQSENEVEKQKFIAKLKTENENNVTRILSLEEEVRELRSKLNGTEQELANVQTDFATYKVRAQAVLRQNQSKDSSGEEELKEEVALLTQEKEDLNKKLALSSEQQRRFESTIDELKGEKNNLQDRCKKLLQLLDETRQQIETMQTENRKQMQEHHEALKMQRLQVDTLTNCFKNQIEEMQKKHEHEITALKTKTASRTMDASDSGLSLSRGAQLTTEQRIELLMMERQDGEGSECTTTAQTRKSTATARDKHEVIPLDELLNNTFDEEDANVERDENDEKVVPKEKFEAQQSRVKHLSTLLSEAEMDVARLTEMNTMLKEELRRQERSSEREKQMQNLEYMKNVIFKFLTINNADEREHLVPVLNIILKLSPDESKTLQSVARGGDGNQSGWSNLLPMW